MGKSLNMLLYGYGGHGGVVADALQDSGIEVRGVFDDRPLRHCPFPFLGIYAPEPQPAVPLLISIGDNEVRKKLAAKVKHAPGLLVHPSVQLSRRADIGEGSIVLHRSIIQAAVHIGRHCIVNSGVIVEHDCRLMDFVHLAPGVILCGGVVVGEMSMVGAGAIVLPGVTIGNNCIIGAGAVVTKPVPNGCKAAGNPARIL